MNNHKRIVIVSGAPGTGKTSVTRMLAEESLCDCAVHLQVDDFWQCIRKGYTYPWLHNSGDQNETVVNAVAAGAVIFAKNGYEVFVDGAIGPWFLTPWIKIAKKGVDVRYIILRPDEKSTVFRAANRQQRDYFPLNTDIVKDVWNSFNDLGRYEAHVLDTTGQAIEESVAVIQKMLHENNFCIT